MTDTTRIIDEIRAYMEHSRLDLYHPEFTSNISSLLGHVAAQAEDKAIIHRNGSEWRSRAEAAEARVRELEWALKPLEALSPDQYMKVHDAAILAYESNTPSHYRYSAVGLRRAVDAAFQAFAALAHPPAKREAGETAAPDTPSPSSHVSVPDTATIAAHMKDFEAFVAKTAPKLHWKIWQDLGADPSRSNGGYDGWQHGFGQALFGPLPLPQLIEEMKVSLTTKVALAATEGSDNG